MSRRTGPGGRLRPSPRSHRAGLREARHAAHPRPEATPRTPAAALPPEAPLVEYEAIDEGTPTDLTAEPAVESPPAAEVLPVAPPPQVDAPPPARPREPEPVPHDVAGARPRGSAARRAETDDVSGERTACTAPQLRRFIKSRAYVPMHELRRRFSINGEEDEVTALDVDAHRIYVGLPAAEGRLLGELVRNGEVGYELSMDPTTPVVVGVYSMRPVSRS